VLLKKNDYRPLITEITRSQTPKQKHKRRTNRNRKRTNRTNRNRKRTNRTSRNRKRTNRTSRNRKRAPNYTRKSTGQNRKDKNSPKGVKKSRRVKHFSTHHRIFQQSEDLGKINVMMSVLLSSYRGLVFFKNATMHHLRKLVLTSQQTVNFTAKIFRYRKIYSEKHALKLTFH